MAVKGARTITRQKTIVFWMILGSYCRRQRRFTIFVPKEMACFEPLTFYVFK